MRHLFIALLAFVSILPACTNRNRVGTQGNTGDGGVQSTSTRYADTSRAGQAARDKMNDTTPHRDTASHPH